MGCITHRFRKLFKHAFAFARTVLGIYSQDPCASTRPSPSPVHIANPKGNFGRSDVILKSTNGRKNRVFGVSGAWRSRKVLQFFTSDTSSARGYALMPWNTGLVILLIFDRACRTLATSTLATADATHAPVSSRHRRLGKIEPRHGHDDEKALSLYDYLKGRRAVVIGPSDDSNDYTNFIRDSDIIVRVNTKVVDGRIWLPLESVALTINATDVVCHHSAPATEKGLYDANWRPETAISTTALTAFEAAGVKYVICTEPYRCNAARAMVPQNARLKFTDLDRRSLAYLRKKNGIFSSGFKCVLTLLNSPARVVVVIGMDFHEGGKRLNYARGYDELSVPPGIRFDSVTLEQQSGVHDFSEEFKEFGNLSEHFKSKLQPMGKLSRMLGGDFSPGIQRREPFHRRVVSFGTLHASS